MSNSKVMQFVRFAVNGCISSAAHYGIYYLVLLWTDLANVAYITGYLLSFVGNYFLTCYFTFRTKPSVRRFLGFSGSHAVNFALHMVLFNLFLWIGVDRLIIPVLVIAIAMLVQFVILRFVFTYSRVKDKM